MTFKHLDLIHCYDSNYCYGNKQLRQLEGQRTTQQVRNDLSLNMAKDKSNANQLQETEQNIRACFLVSGPWSLFFGFWSWSLVLVFSTLVASVCILVRSPSFSPGPYSLVLMFLVLVPIVSGHQFLDVPGVLVPEDFHLVPVSLFVVRSRQLQVRTPCSLVPIPGPCRSGVSNLFKFTSSWNSIYLQNSWSGSPNVKICTSIFFLCFTLFSLSTSIRVAISPARKVAIGHPKSGQKSLKDVIVKNNTRQMLLDLL